MTSATPLYCNIGFGIYHSPHYNAPDPKQHCPGAKEEVVWDYREEGWVNTV